MPFNPARHPRYILLVVVLLGASYFYFSTPSQPHSYTAGIIGFPGDPSLPSRIVRAEKSYQKILVNREALIKKHGPLPSQVVMFPPDRAPWPAYTVWDFFPPAFDCPHELERVGNLGDGGKWTCGLSRVAEKPDCIIYSFGMDWESSWEAAVLDGSESCQIWGYDHNAKSFGRQVSHGGLTRKFRTHFTSHVQLGPSDKHEHNDEPKFYTLETLMNMNGHTYIDILKIDIEGFEFDTLRSLIQPYVEKGQPLPFGQLQIELHLWSRSFADFLSFWELLEKAGLRPVMMEANLVYVNYNRQSGAELAEYTFINVKGNNIFIADPENAAGGVHAGHVHA